jgi:two-component system sensor histidine kinase KdpD
VAAGAALVALLTASLRGQREAGNLRAETGNLRAEGRAKDEFVGFVAHELRSPVAIIAGSAGLLAKAEQMPVEDRQAVAADIVDAAERLQSIVATLASLAKAESGAALEVEPILVHRIAARAARLHRTRFASRVIEIRTEDGIGAGLGDRDATEQVLVNLLSNAEKYGDPDAPITIEVRSSETGVVASVTNEGPVLDPEAFDRVFEPFFRLAATADRASGIGLGLTICHRLVSAQGGQMFAESRPEGGARFEFTLPRPPA